MPVRGSLQTSAMTLRSYPVTTTVKPRVKVLSYFLKVIHCIYLSVTQWYGRIPQFGFPLLLVSIVHFCISLQLYIYESRPAPPRRSSIDRSMDFNTASTFRLYSRHDTPWYKYPDLQPNSINDVLSAEDTRYRFLVSTAPDELNENIAQRFLVLNFERLVADMLNLTFIDRHHTFGSLTRDDDYAVENFLGWSSPDFFQVVCKRQKQVRILRACNERLVVCAKLHRQNEFVDSIVALPAALALCARRPDTAQCRKAVAAFQKLHPWERTLFQMPTSLCQSQLAWAEQRTTRGWHFRRYWLQPHTAQLDPRHVNIAVHVRRTDSGRWRLRSADGQSSGNRFSITDRAYAIVVAQVIDVVRKVEARALARTDNAARARLVFRVHIYSEGLVRPRTWHPILRWMIRSGLFGRDVNDFDTSYVADDGYARGAGYWESLLEEAFGKQFKRDTKVDLHVSEDVLEGMEQMIAADVFISSAASISVHLVGQLSRGIVFLPVRPPRDVNANKAVEWNPEGGYGAWSAWHAKDSPFFDKGEFKKIWQGYRMYIGANIVPLGLPE